jgi:LacI family repressor for deo operon, udp, cdd, tsx, nupC, and nupG
VHPLFEQISVNPQKGITLAHQLKQQITWLIASGKLQAGDRLPSVRLLAQHLDINLHTVRSAYQMLEADSLVETRQGWGTQVLAFDPRRIGHAAASMRTHTIGVIVASLYNPFYHAFLQGAAEVADEDQSLLFVCDTQDDPAEAWRYFTQLSARQVDGIIIASHGMEDLLCNEPDTLKEGFSAIPFVTADWPDCEGPSVMLDLEGAGYQATHHLLQHGHRRIGLITYAAEAANVSPVDNGYRRALQEAGIHSDSLLVARVGGFDVASGAEGARRLLSLPQPPTGIFAITDLMAAGALQTIKAAGLRVPQDIALVGFNDIPMAAWLDPPLTTVAAPAFHMGQEAMRMLNSLIGRKPLTQKQVVLPTALVVRQSCGEHFSEPDL